MKKGREFWINILILICFVILFLPFKSFLYIKIVTLIVMLITVNFLYLSVSVVSLALALPLLGGYGSFFLNPFSYSSLFVTKQLYLFLFVLIAFVLNILIVSLRLYRLKPEDNVKLIKILRLLNIAVYKVRFVIPIIAFVLLIVSVVYGFSGLYSAYEDRYFGYYAMDAYEHPPENTTVKITDVKNSIRAYSINYLDERGKLLKREDVKVYGDGGNGTGNIYGNEIFVDTYDKTEKHINSLVIDRGFINSQDNLNLVDFSEADYFSAETFFTVGYGDIVPHSYQMKQLAQLEMFTGYFISCIFVPFLIVAIQKLLE